MNFQQLRVLNEIIRNGLNITDAASSIHASQSGVSKQIKELEFELGVDIFVRKGKRITDITPVGEGIAEIAKRILLEADNLKKHSTEFINADSGKLRIATTHNQARHILPKILKDFSAKYPKIELDIKQATPFEAERALANGDADIAIATEALDSNHDIISFPCFRWHHIIIAPHNHPLLDIENPTIETIAKYPIITYSPEFSGRSKIDKAFNNANIRPDIRFATMDSDIIKTYVEIGLGIGIISEMAKHEIDCNKLSIIANSQRLFEQSTTKLAFRRGALVQKYILEFAKLLVPSLKQARINYDAKIAARLEDFNHNARYLIPGYDEWQAEFEDTIPIIEKRAV